MSDLIDFQELISTLTPPLSPEEIEEGEEIRSLTGVPIVYLIGNIRTGLVKIGRSTNIRSRLAALEASCGVELELMSYRAAKGRDFELAYPESTIIERWMHERFAKDRQRGEWFVPSKELFEAFGLEWDV